METSDRLRLVRRSMWACAFAWLGCGPGAVTDAGHGSDVVVADATVGDVGADTASPLDVAADLFTPIDTPQVAEAGDALAYPAGPYGNTMGATLENLSWVGYVNTAGMAVSTTLPYGPTSLGALRGSGHGYAMIHLSDFL